MPPPWWKAPRASADPPVGRSSPAERVLQTSAAAEIPQAENGNARADGNLPDDLRRGRPTDEDDAVRPGDRPIKRRFPVGTLLHPSLKQLPRGRVFRKRRWLLALGV